MVTATEKTKKIVKTNRKVTPICNFTPNPMQIKILNDKSPVVLLAGEAGSGKSRVMLEKIHAFCLNYQGAVAGIFRKQREMLKHSVIDTLDRDVIGNDPHVHYSASGHCYNYNNVSQILLFGMKDTMQQEASRSVQFDIVAFEEGNAFTEKDFDELKRGLRLNHAGWRQIIISTNADSQYHWINERLIVGQEASYYFCLLEDNLANLSPDYLARLDSMKGVLKERLRYGRWIQAEGIIFTTFNPAIHLQHRDKSEMRYFIGGCDIGTSNPATTLTYGIDNDGDMHLYRTWYKAGTIQHDHAVETVRRAREDNMKYIIVDPSALSFIMELKLELQRQNVNCEVVPADNTVAGGIQNVMDFLAAQIDGAPGLTIEPDGEGNENFVREIQCYAYKNSKTKEEPIKENDHAIDPTRYIATWLKARAMKSRACIRGGSEVRRYEENIKSENIETLNRAALVSRVFGDD